MALCLNLYLGRMHLGERKKNANYNISLAELMDGVKMKLTSKPPKTTTFFG